jgi:LPS-assembly lipoprotein
MWSSDRRRICAAALGLAAFGLSGCGFRPLYGDGSPAREIFGTVDVDVVPTLSSYTLQQRLQEQLGFPEAPTHVLTVDTEIETAGVALTDENVTTRFNVRGEATFQLRPIGSDRPVLSERVRAIAGYSAPESETASAYASRIAEQDAIERVMRQLADRIVTRLSITAGEWVPVASDRGA